MLGKEGVWWLYYKQNEGENFIAPNVTVIQYCPKALNVIVNLFKEDNVILNDIGAKFSFMFYFYQKATSKYIMPKIM